MTRWAVEDGLPLCSDFGLGRCHARKTRHTLRISRGWLDSDMVEWLATMGYAEWQADGSVAGTHCRLFLPVHDEGGWKRRW